MDWHTLGDLLKDVGALCQGVAALVRALRGQQLRPRAADAKRHDDDPSDGASPLSAGRRRPPCLVTPHAVQADKHPGRPRLAALADDPAADILDRGLDAAATDDPLNVYLREAPAALTFEGERAALEDLEHRPLADMDVVEIGHAGTYVPALFVSTGDAESARSTVVPSITRRAKARVR